MAKIVWTDPAWNDLEEIAEYIAFDNPEAAGKTVARILRHVKLLEKHPRIGSVPPELPDSEYRQIVESPCRIFYKIVPGGVRIIHVLRFERLLRTGNLED